jgi:signal transduction histidine kinase
VVTLLVAWQYLWRAAVASALVLCAADFALSLPFNRPGGMLYPLFLVISLARVGTVTLVAMAIGWLIERQREQKAALAAANQKLAAYAATTEQLAISRERNRLARELHDTLAHSLAAVTVQLEGVLALWEHNAEAARAMLASALQNARTGLIEARRALKALRASPLEENGLVVALGNLARSAAARANLQLNLESPPEGLSLRADQEQFLYRVAQEAISNVVRHAHATELRVTLERNNGQLALTIADNGQGFEQATADSSGHFGLKGMHERVEMAGGWLTVESARQRGTTVRAAIDVEDGT